MSKTSLRTQKKQKKKEDKIEIKEEKQLNALEIDQEEKAKLRSNMNKYFKRAKAVESEEDKENKKNNKGLIPAKEINPYELFTQRQEDGDIDYSEAQKAYKLNILEGDNKFITDVKNFDKLFVNLVTRKVVRFERNLTNLAKTGKFFILYELQVSDHTHLCMTEIATLNVIKSVLLSYPDVHLVIAI